MIVGIGVDICQIDRIGAMLRRRPGLRERLFTRAEACRPDGALRTPASLAARFAAKEALAKALGSPGGMVWVDAEVRSGADGRPVFEVRGTVAKRMEELGICRVQLSLSHEAGLAAAFVICEGES